MRHERPAQVEAARQSDNHSALSRMGKRGASHRVQLADLHAAQRAEKVAEVTTEKAKLEPIDLEGNVLPPDEILPLDQQP